MVLLWCMSCTPYVELTYKADYGLGTPRAGPVSSDSRYLYGIHCCKFRFNNQTVGCPTPDHLPHSSTQCPSFGLDRGTGIHENCVTSSVLMVHSKHGVPPNISWLEQRPPRSYLLSSSSPRRTTDHSPTTCSKKNEGRNSSSMFSIHLRVWDYSDGLIYAVL